MCKSKKCVLCTVHIENPPFHYNSLHPVTATALLHSVEWDALSKVFSNPEVSVVMKQIVTNLQDKYVAVTQIF